MRNVHNFDELNAVLREMDERIRRLELRAVDMKGRQIKNLGHSIDPEDAVIRRELTVLRKDLETRIVALEKLVL